MNRFRDRVGVVFVSLGLAAFFHGVLIAWLSAIPVDEARIHGAPLPVPLTNTTGGTLLDRVTHVSEICGVHQVKMAVKEVPVHYGLQKRHSREAPTETMRRFFPNTERMISGGCGVGSYLKARIYVCADCIGAERSWRFSKLRSTLSRIEDERLVEGGVHE